MRVLLFTLPPKKEDSPQRHKGHEEHKGEESLGEERQERKFFGFPFPNLPL
jgi:hypothetical protein